jgi:hypothetical protein
MILNMPESMPIVIHENIKESRHIAVVERHFVNRSLARWRLAPPQRSPCADVMSARTARRLSACCQTPPTTSTNDDAPCIPRRETRGPQFSSVSRTLAIAGL